MSTYNAPEEYADKTNKTPITQAALDQVAYFQVTKPRDPPVYTFFGNIQYAPSIVVRPEDIKVVLKSGATGIVNADNSDDDDTVYNVTKGQPWGQGLGDPRETVLYHNGGGFVEEGMLHDDGRWYNDNTDNSDTIERDAEGKWRWHSSGNDDTCTQPNVWMCTLCERPCVMVCPCGYETQSGLFVTRMLQPHQFKCRHLTRARDFICRVCRKQGADK